MSKSSPRHATKSSPFNTPANARLLSEWALLPLRVFLGATFLYAGFQKLANPNFFINASPISIHSQLTGAARFSPIHALLSHMVGLANPIGLTIAYAELAVGLGILIGLFSRIAAIGGALLSFSLFLAVSFHTSPYFTNADIVFFFAWLPFIFAGSPPQLSVDAWLATFAKKGIKIGPSGVATPVQIDALSRRKMMVSSAAAATAALGTLIAGGTVAATGKLIGNAKSPTTNGFGSTTTTTGASTTPTTLTPTTTTTVGSKYSGTKLGAASQVAVGKPATFTVPSTGDPAIVFNQGGGKFVAYDTVCPHAGCTVGYYSGNTMQCPCHGSQFTISGGNVLNGPAPHGLSKLNVVLEADGNLYLQ
jgi:thiosulfate dehydrogenase [quinone] large subunit